MVSSFLIKSLIEHYILLANGGDHDQMLHSVETDLGLHCLPCLIKRMLGLFHIVVTEDIQDLIIRLK